jgi:hypothetical protein
MLKKIDLHIGNIICEHLEKEGRKKTWLAQQLDCSLSCLCKMLKQKSIHSDTLLRISFACKHDFTKYLSMYYDENQHLD